MKKYLRTFILILSIVFTSCNEDVIHVNLQTVAPRLTIEASLDWEKGTTGNEQTIKLSTSTPYYDTTTNANVSGASVKVINNENLTEFVFVDQNNGQYTTSDFIPILNQSYTLEIIYNEERYSATETLMPVVDIIEINQSIEEVFDVERTQVNFSIDDPIDVDNYYLLKIKEQEALLPWLASFGDEFIDGKKIELSYTKEGDDDKDFISGEKVFIDLFGISEAYSNYMSLLITLSEGTGIFGEVPVAAKGNCINLDNTDNYAHGYFRLTQVAKATYIIQ